MGKTVVISLFLLIWPLTVWAATEDAEGKNIPVPDISYSQKVEIIVPIQQNKDVLSATINQKDKNIELLMTVSNECIVERAKYLGNAFLMRTKTITLDDPAGKEEPGTGLYTYRITITRSNGKIIVEGIKASDKEKVEWF